MREDLRIAAGSSVDPLHIPRPEALQGKLLLDPRKKCVIGVCPVRGSCCSMECVPVLPCLPYLFSILTGNANSAKQAGQL